MIIGNTPCDHPEIPLNSLYGLTDVRPYYYLSALNLVINQMTNSYCAVNITQAGYPYVTVALGGMGSDVWRKITLHKIIALARINNGPYICIEHINDNPLDLGVSNLKFSNQVANTKSAFANNHRSVASAIFRVELFDGRIFLGTLKQVQEWTGISRITLYDRYYKGPRDFSGNPRQRVKSVIKIGMEEAPVCVNNRSIDYRDGAFQGQIVFDNLVIDALTQ